MDTADAEGTVRAYYESLRQGEPLAPYFAPEPGLVKVGISERLLGYEAVAEGLRRQTRETTDWAVDSRDLRVTERDGYAWFGDAVRMAWTVTETGTRHDFDARWSGTLERDDGWRFVAMHVSAPHEL